MRKATLTDYASGIAYGTGRIASEKGKTYLHARNKEEYYLKILEAETGYRVYKSSDGRGGIQWNIKARNVEQLPPLPEIREPKEFIRAYMELHAVLDLANATTRQGKKIKILRLRIYGSEETLSWINENLPAGKKKMQYIKNRTGEYTGETCALYYQSKREIPDILGWIDGIPKNEEVWKKWDKVLKEAREYSR